MFNSDYIEVSSHLSDDTVNIEYDYIPADELDLQTTVFKMKQLRIDFKKSQKGKELDVVLL